MRRKMKLIRKILEWSEANATGEPTPIGEIEGYTDKQIQYHIQLCSEAGYLLVQDMLSLQSTEFYITQLTWRGHETLVEFRSIK